MQPLLQYISKYQGGNKMAKSKALKEMTVYECDACEGSGETILDWDARNQMMPSVGFSREAAEKNRRLAKRAYGKCSKCKGKGFILKHKKA